MGKKCTERPQFLSSPFKCVQAVKYSLPHLSPAPNIGALFPRKLYSSLRPTQRILASKARGWWAHGCVHRRGWKPQWLLDLYRFVRHQHHQPIVSNCSNLYKHVEQWDVNGSAEKWTLLRAAWADRVLQSLLSKDMFLLQTFVQVGNCPGFYRSLNVWTTNTSRSLGPGSCQNNLAKMAHGCTWYVNRSVVDESIPSIVQPHFKHGRASLVSHFRLKPDGWQVPSR